MRSRASRRAAFSTSRELGRWKDGVPVGELKELGRWIDDGSLRTYVDLVAIGQLTADLKLLSFFPPGLLTRGSAAMAREGWLNGEDGLPRSSPSDIICWLCRQPGGTVSECSDCGNRVCSRCISLCGRCDREQCEECCWSHDGRCRGPGTTTAALGVAAIA